MANAITVEAVTKHGHTDGEVAQDGKPCFWQDGFSGMAQAIAAVGCVPRFNELTATLEARLPGSDEFLPLKSVAPALVEILGRGVKAFHATKDGEVRRYKFNCTNKEVLAFGEVAWAVDSDWCPRVNPFLNWVYTLDKDTDDDILKGWLFRLFEFEDPPELVEWTAKYIAMSVISRQLHPDHTSAQVLPILYSADQGVGKSSMLEFALPLDDNGKKTYWASGDLTEGSEKERIEKILGTVIFEADEWDVEDARQTRTLKSFVSRNTDRVRLAYRHDPENYPRRSTIVATTNMKLGVPYDPSGSRRYVQLTITKGQEDRKNIRLIMEGLRKALWAQALHAVQNEVPFHMSPELHKRLQVPNIDKHRVRDVLEDAVEVYLGERIRKDCQFVYFHEIADGVTAGRDRGLSENERTSVLKRVSRMLKMLGYETHRRRFTAGQLTIVGRSGVSREQLTEEVLWGSGPVMKVAMPTTTTV